MGSSSDWETLRHAAEVLDELPGRLRKARRCRRIACQTTCSPLPIRRWRAGLQAIIAGAGGAAHLPGMLAAKTVVPVLGVPVASKHLNGVDSLYSIVQMPKGIPVATFAIGPAGAANAALFAVAMLASHDEALRQRLHGVPVAPDRGRARHDAGPEVSAAPVAALVAGADPAAAARAPAARQRDARRARRRAARAHVRARRAGPRLPRRGARARRRQPGRGRGRPASVRALHRQRRTGAAAARVRCRDDRVRERAGRRAAPTGGGAAGGAACRCRGRLPASCAGEALVRAGRRALCAAPGGRIGGRRRLAQRPRRCCPAS